MSSFDHVIQADAAFKEAAQADHLDPRKEAAALAMCLECSDVSDICMKVSRARWIQCEEAWKSQLKFGSDELGQNIKSVVEDLDAPHLRPTSILDRIQGGVNPACHSLFALMDHLKNRRGANTNSEAIKP